MYFHGKGDFTRLEVIVMIDAGGNGLGKVRIQKRRGRRQVDKEKMFIRSVYAGIMIGIGGIIYLSVENRIVGSALFSFGLLTIVTQGFCLYTGKVGSVKKAAELLDMAVIVAGNYVGTFAAAFLAKAARLEISSAELAARKLDNSLWNVFLLSVFCGVMMYLAIDNHDRSGNILFIIVPVMIFILAGFEHSIADMFYFHLAGSYSLKTAGYLLVMLLGNGIGAKLFDLKPE